jgi:hypothetical protein
MAPRGPILPRKDRTASEARSALGNSAFQIGVLLAIQRNRWGMRQEDLAAEISCKQGDISALERGARPARPLSDRQLKQLFKALDIVGERQLREFLKWWQAHG